MVYGYGLWSRKRLMFLLMKPGNSQNFSFRSLTSSYRSLVSFFISTLKNQLGAYSRLRIEVITNIQKSCFCSISLDIYISYFVSFTYLTYSLNTSSIIPGRYSQLPLLQSDSSTISRYRSSTSSLNFLLTLYPLVFAIFPNWSPTPIFEYQVDVLIWMFEFEFGFEGKSFWGRGAIRWSRSSVTEVRSRRCR